MQNLLNDALDYAARGWSVLPLHAAVRGQCTCGLSNCKDAGKHPHTRHGAHDATKDPHAIQLWFDLWNNANVGIATGAPSGFFALDVDPRSGGDDSLAELQARHGRLPHTVEAVTGGGGAHIWFASPNFHVKNIYIAPGVQVKGDGGCIVAPNSLHKSGRRYEFEASSHPDRVKLAAPPDWLTQILYDRAHEASREPFALADTPRNLPRTAWRILCGTSRKEYKSPSETEQAAITAMINANFDFERVLDAFERYAHSETHFKIAQRKRGQREAERWLKLSYDEALTFARTHQREDYTRALELAQARRAWALENLPGRTGATQCKVLLAHCEIVESCGKTEYHAGERDLADAANVTRHTAHRANAALVKLGALRVVKAYDPTAPSWATRWELLPLLPLVDDCRVSVPLPHALGYCEWYTDATHDAFRARAGMALVFSLLKQKPHSARELVKASKRSRGTVWRALKELEASKIIKRDGEKYRVVTGARLLLDQIATNRGTRGARARQIKRHADERKLHQSELRAGGER